MIHHAKVAEEIRINKLPHVHSIGPRTHIGEAYEQLGEYTKAMEHLIWCLDYCDKDPSCLLNGPLQRLGRLNLLLGNLDKALSFFEQGLEVSLASGDLYEQGHGLLGIADVYLQKGDLKEADNHLQRALGKFEESKPFSSKGEVYIRLGTVATQKGHYELGETYFYRAIESPKIQDNTRKISDILGNIGDLYFAQGQYHLSLEQYLEAARLAEQIQFKDQLARMNKKLASNYKALDNTDLAYQYIQQYSMLKDTLFEEGKLRLISEMESKYELSKKETQIGLQKTQLDRQKLINWGVGLLALLLFFVAFLLWKNASQRKKTNTQLRQLDSTKSRFFTNISHELRTPLTLILGPLESALNRTKNKAVSQDLELVNSNSKKLLNLVNEIMDLSKLESGKLELHPTAVHFYHLLRRIFFAYESLATLRGIHLDFNYGLPENYWVKLDISKFEKIVNNLLSNALKFTEKGGRIQLEVMERHGANNGKIGARGLGVLTRGTIWVEIRVQDTGQGIHADNLPRVFDRFYQSNQRDESLQGGTGIGLALAKELTHLFKGELTAVSELGEGTVFYLQLPLELTEAKANYQPELMNTLEYSQPENDIETSDYHSIVLNQNIPKILVVEDNPEMSRYLVQTLAGRYKCSTAMDGVEALDILQSQKFDLITSDVMMPNMDGFTFLKKVHERELFSHTPVILLTARALEEDKLKGFQLGVDDYMTKPFSSKELIARIDNLLKNKKEREAWQEEIGGVTNDTSVDEIISVEQEFLKKAEALALLNVGDFDYRVSDMAKEMAYSERQLRRLIKKLTGYTPKQFIRELRLQKAWQLLQTQQYASIAEVSNEVGIGNPSYLSKLFLERFGMKPSEVG